MPTHSPAATGRLLPPELRRDCPEMDAMAAYMCWWELVADGALRDPDYASQTRRFALRCRRELIDRFTAQGWEAAHIRELRRAVVRRACGRETIPPDADGNIIH